MKRLLPALVLGLMMGGCKVQHVPYHASALPNAPAHVSTSLKLVEGTGKTRSRLQPFAVLTARHDDGVEYIVVSPVKNPDRRPFFPNLLLVQSASISSEAAGELIRGLDGVIAAWNVKMPRSEGRFYEFRHPADDDASRQAGEAPTVSFTYSNTYRGSTAELMLGGDSVEGATGRPIVFKKRHQIQDFRNLLSDALARTSGSSDSVTERLSPRSQSSSERGRRVERY